MGAEVEITEIPGYLPRHNNELMDDLMKENLVSVLGEEAVAVSTRHGSGSSDIGDVMHVLPAIHPYMGGVEGSGHSKNYVITDEVLANVEGAKAMAMTVIDLLVDGAEKGKEVVDNFEPIYDTAGYLKMWEDFFSVE